MKPEKTPDTLKLRILHVDMDAFFASIEQRDNPSLRGKPVVVGAGPDERGVVSTASYEARKFGIHSAMPSREAGRLCPHAVFIRPDHARYSAVSRQIFEIFNRYTPFVEGLSCDEAFLDVGGSFRLFGEAAEIAEKIRCDIRRETGLTASVGVAANKFLAKLASDMHKPDGLTVVPADPDSIKAFLDPLPVRSVFGVGKTTAEALASAGIRTIFDVRNAPPGVLRRLLGAARAGILADLASGIDNRPVQTEREEKTISGEYTFPEDEPERETVRERLLEIASKVGRRIREAGKRAATGKIKIRWGDFSTATRQKRFPEPVCDDISFRRLASELFDSVYTGAPVRLIGFGVTDLESGPGEATLFASESLKRRERLCAAVDCARRNLDGGSISFGIRRTTPTPGSSSEDDSDEC